MRNTDVAALCRKLQDHRVVTAEDLRVAGIDGNAIVRARGNGTLQDVPGVDGIYVVGKEPYDDLVRMHVANRLAGENGVITGIWATRLQRLPWVPSVGACMVRIDAAHKHRGSEGFIMVCRTNSLERVETFEYEGLSIAQVPQAVIDACRQLQTDTATRHLNAPHLDLRNVRGLVLGSIAKERCTATELEVVLSQGSIRHTAMIRRSLGDAARGAVSPPEAELVDDLLPYGIPFYCNVEVWVDGVFVGVADVYLVGTGVGGELDSKQEHGEEDKLDATLVRHDGFNDVDIDLRHVTPTRYRNDPQRFHRTLFLAAKKRLDLGLGDPPGLELRPRGPLLCGPVSSLTPYTLRTPVTPAA